MSIRLEFQDGAVVIAPHGVLPKNLERESGHPLPRDLVAVRLNGVLHDLETPLRGSGTFETVTADMPEALHVLRHSAAHVLATAVRRLRPEAAIGFGPAIDDGFYYDFEVSSPFTPDDLIAIEDEMRRVSAEALPFMRAEIDRSAAERVFSSDPLKLERLRELGNDDVISTYADGEFVDLCRGPHLQSTADVKHFKLTHTAGAYWRGDSRRQMLQRIYGTAWFSEADVRKHLDRIEEAKRRDHRVLGRELDLFMIHEYAPGAVFWTERGTLLYNTIVDFIRELQVDDYLELKTPLIFNKKLWETSGHWDTYRENMFLVHDDAGEPRSSLKPMNCPSHYLRYLAKKHSYRELPIRYSTFDVLHRNEVVGALSGLTRVRQFQQDDCHIFLRQDQIESEVASLVRFILGYYGVFGLPAKARFATRPEQRIGSDELWDNAETDLRRALEGTGLEYEVKPGDGAFYGPKIDFDVTDSLGRSWQLGTVQLDYNAPDRFDLSYVGQDNKIHRPVVIHRAVSGSIERFIGILIEHYAGAFPLWLSPEQVRVIPVADDQSEYTERVARELRKSRLRVSTDLRSETLQYRIADAARSKTPYIAVVGARESDAGTVSIRLRGAAKGAKSLTTGVDEFRLSLAREVQTKALMPTQE